MMNKFISILVMCNMFMMGSVSYAQPMDASMKCSQSAIDLKLTLRKLWEDHITYTRNYIISAIANLEDANPVADRLMRNQDEIGNAMKSYYGNAAGKKLAALLRDHIGIAAEVVNAAIQGDDENIKMAEEKWHANADEIALFLNKANPTWALKDLTDLLYKHLDFTTGEVVSRLHKDWAADIGFYDKGHLHMLMFSDVLADGIIKQFPDHFRK